MKPTKPILAAVDFSASSASVVAHAAALAAADGAPLVLVHVVSPDLLPHRPGSKPAVGLVESAVSEARRSLAELAESHAGGCAAVIEVPVGRPADEIHALVDRMQAGLLVVSANQPGRKRLGTTSSRCVRTVHCDVLMLREVGPNGFRKVVACVDLSPTSEVVLARAIQETAADTELEIVHVMYPPDRDHWGVVLGDEVEQAASDQRAEVRAAMDRLVRGFAGQLEGRRWTPTFLESTVPSVELTCHIGDTGADLVVLGTRGHSKLGAVFLGTNAERLLHDAPASVFAVRA